MNAASLDDGVDKVSSLRARRDAAVVIALTSAFFLASSAFELSERIQAWAHGHESWQLDEVLLALVALVAGLAWFGWRRLRESRAEARARVAAERRTAALLEENRALARRIISAQEEERRSIARELHDELGQCCNAIKLDASAIQRQLPDGLASLHASTRAIVATAGGMHDIVRGMLHRLRPAALDDLGLVACVQEAAESWEQRHGIACVFLPEGDLDGLHESINITIYRIVQECLTNVSRHAAADQATIRIQRQSDTTVAVCVEDSGRGAAGQARHGGLGIVGMTERVRGLGGSFAIEPRAGGGARVLAIIPVRG